MYTDSGWVCSPTGSVCEYNIGQGDIWTAKFIYQTLLLKKASLLYDIIFVIISPVCIQIAAEVAAPLAQCKKVTLVSSGKGDVGAAKLTGEVFDIIERMPKMVESMTGVDLSKVRTYMNLCNYMSWSSLRCLTVVPDHNVETVQWSRSYQINR